MHMSSKSIQVRLDSDLKKRVERVLKQIGVDMPTAVRMFFVKVAATGGIPFSLQNEPEERYTPEQLARLDRLVEEAKKGKGVSRAFSSVDEMLDDLHSRK
jgi:DNA-damage-inducible protein J